MTLQQRIQNMKAHGFTQAYLAKHSGVDASTISVLKNYGPVGKGRYGHAELDRVLAMLGF